MKIVGFADDAFDMDIIVDELSKKLRKRVKINKQLVCDSKLFIHCYVICVTYQNTPPPYNS